MNNKRKNRIVNKENTLKRKVGDGGFKLENIEKAQGAIDNNTVNFIPLAKDLLDDLGRAIAGDSMGDIIHPILQLKAQGTMFNYPVFTDISSDVLRFLEDVNTVDDDVLKIVFSFYQTLKIIHELKIRNSSDKRVKELDNELKAVYARYMSKKKVGE